MPIVSVSWSELASKLDGATCLVALTNRHIAILSTLAEQLRWSKTWRTDDLDTDDLEEITLEVNDLIANLTMPVNLVDIISLIDEVEDLLRAIEAHAGCCTEVDPTNGDQYTDDVIDGVGDVPQNIIDAGYADDASDWSGFDDYKCIISHVMIDSMAETLRQIEPLFTSAGLILGGIASVAAVIGAIVATGGTALVLGIIAGVATVSTAYAGLTELGSSGTGSLADSIDTNHDDLACAIYSADGSTNAVAALKNKIDELYSDANALILKNMGIEPSLKALYGGRYDQQDIAEKLAEEGYDIDAYTCSCGGPTTEDWTYDFTADLEGWSSAVPTQRGIAWNAGQFIRLSYPSTSGWSFFQSYNAETGAAAYTRFGVNPITHYCNRIVVKFMFNMNGYGGESRLRLAYYDAQLNQWVYGTSYGSNTYTPGQWHTLTWELGGTKALRNSASIGAIQTRLSSSSTAPTVDVDYIEYQHDI